MTGVLDSMRDYAQSHPMSVAAGLVVALPGTYLYITGKSLRCAAGLCGNVSPASQSHLADVAHGLSVFETQHPLDLRLALPTSRWSDKPTPTLVLRIIEDTRTNIVSLLAALGERLGIDMLSAFRLLDDRWTSHFPLSRFVSVAITTALPGAFLAVVRNFPHSWAARHQRSVASTLHVLALVTVASQRLSVQDVIVTTLVMVSFEALQQTLDQNSGEPPSAIETPLSQTHSAVADSDIYIPSPDERHDALSKSSVSDNDSCKAISGDDEIARLQHRLTQVKTADRAKEHDLHRTQRELHNARATLNETFAEYASLRDEMKQMKQAIGRDYQAVIYRKDIELFALRKANEQKENYIKERDSKLDDVYYQQKSTLELKDAQLRNLKERIAFLEQQSPRPANEGRPSIDSDHQAALQVKLLHVKGRNSLEIQPREEKDMEIAKLKEELGEATRNLRALAKTQDELCRAWDATYEVQNSLNEERLQHAQTREKLKEALATIEEERKKSTRYSPTRLPTIEEQDKNELESMFDAAQNDNLRLYADVEALDKRVRESNARLFTTEQELDALKEQLRLEKAINEDMETARPSLVHRVHLQRMEGQLKETRDALSAKEDEIDRLKKSIAIKDNNANDFQKESENSASMRKQLEEENERLQKSVSQLEATKEQLMLDHERLAQHRARQRTTSAEHTSARSSGATLISDPSMHPITNSDEPMPARPVSLRLDSSQILNQETDEPLPTRPVSMANPLFTRPGRSPSPERPASLMAAGSIQATPERVVRIDPTPMISNDIPPPELRQRSKSISLKNFFRKLGGEKQPEKSIKLSKKGKEAPKKGKDEKEKARPKTALASRDTKSQTRPQSSGAILEPMLKRTGSDQRSKSAALPKELTTLRVVQPTPTKERDIFPTPKKEKANPMDDTTSVLNATTGAEKDDVKKNESAQIAAEISMSPATYDKPDFEAQTKPNNTATQEASLPVVRKSSPSRYYAKPSNVPRPRSTDMLQTKFEEDRSVSTGSGKRPESRGFSRRLLRKSVA